MKTMKSMVPVLALGALFAAGAQADSDCHGTTGIWGLAPAIDAATDDGAGRIRVEWSLAPPLRCHSPVQETPEKVCAAWGLATGEGGASEECFTSEAGSQSDLVFDSGMADYDALRESGVASAAYDVKIGVTYGGLDILMSSGESVATVEVAAPWTNAQEAW